MGPSPPVRYREDELRVGGRLNLKGQARERGTATHRPTPPQALHGQRIYASSKRSLSQKREEEDVPANDEAASCTSIRAKFSGRRVEPSSARSDGAVNTQTPRRLEPSSTTEFPRDSLSSASCRSSNTWLASPSVISARMLSQGEQRAGDRNGEAPPLSGVRWVAMTLRLN